MSALINGISSPEQHMVLTWENMEQPETSLLLFITLAGDDPSLGYWDKHLLWNPSASNEHLFLINTNLFPSPVPAGPRSPLLGYWQQQHHPASPPDPDSSSGVCKPRANPTLQTLPELPAASRSGADLQAQLGRYHHPPALLFLPEGPVSPLPTRWGLSESRSNYS